VNLRKWITPVATLALTGTMVAVPVSSFAQGRDWGYSYQQHRQGQQNQWRNLAIGAAAVGVLGMITHNDALSVLGLGGAAYSGYRLSQDGANGRYGYYGNSNCNTGGYSDYSNGGYSDYGYSNGGYNNYGYSNGGYNNYGYDNSGYNGYGNTDYGYSNYGRRDTGYKSRTRSVTRNSNDWRNGR